jgi:hypothetical protein
MTWGQFFIYNNAWFNSNTLEKSHTYPARNTSASFKNDELIRIGNGYFSNRRGNLTIASHCSPTFPERSPTTWEK